MEEYPPIPEPPSKVNIILPLYSSPTPTKSNVELQEIAAPLPTVNIFPRDFQGPYAIIRNGKNNNMTGGGIMHIGNSLCKLNVKPKNLKVKAKNTIRLECPNLDTANRFLNNNTLLEVLDVKTKIQSSLLFKHVVVYGDNLDITGRNTYRY